MNKLAPTLALLLTLAGCATTPQPVSPATPAVPGAAASAGTATPPALPGAAPAPAVATPSAPAALAVERQWLQSWFTGTPVAIAQRGDGAVTVDVPQEFCFDVGQSSVKPALAAVLDKVAQSLRRTSAARLPLVAAPGDAKGAPALALQRATQVHKHLLARGVPAARLGSPVASATAAVQLRMDMAAPLP